MRIFLSLMAVVTIVSPLAAEEWVSPKDQPIPVAYQGRWALSLASCTESDGPAIVEIGPRTLFFYESYGFLELAQLNEIEDPPEFYGEFAFAAELEFSRKVYRLQMAGRNLLITELRNKDDPPNRMPWFHCPSVGNP
jgi:hypothetical protein